MCVKSIECTEYVLEYLEYSDDVEVCRLIGNSRGCRLYENTSNIEAVYRSAQWAYWHRHDDLWLETGGMLEGLGTP